MCRFGFPKPLEGRTRLQFTKLDNGRVRCELLTAHNDPYLNTHCWAQLHGWLANVDLQIILDKDTAVKYMVKYASKAEKRLTDAREVFKAILDADTGRPDDVNHCWIQMMLRTAGCRDMGA